jgi:hypothetical protein
MTDEAKNPKFKVVGEQPSAEEVATPIIKPAAFSTDKFRSQTPDTIAGVETLLTALPHHSISQAKDFVRLHPDVANYWSGELCFVHVPIKGARKEALHLIVEYLAMKFLPSARIQRFRLALATKPNDAFFLCHVPSRNTDNSWNETNLQGCEQARFFWTQVTSRREEGFDSYEIKCSRDRDAFPEPKWPTQSLDELIGVTFANRIIETADHPGLLRLIGAKQTVT